MIDLIIDLSILGIIVLSAIISAYYGFVRTVIEIAGFIAAILIATAVSKPIADFLYNKVIEPSVVSRIEKSADEDTHKKLENIYDEMPSYIKNNAEKFGVSKEDINDTFSDNISNGITVAAKKTLENNLKPFAVEVLNLLISRTIIVILLILVGFLAKVINKLFSVKFLDKINKSLGAFLGCFKGLIIVFVLFIVINLFFKFKPDGFGEFNKVNFNASPVIKFINNIINNL